ncbi:hypothetical protein PR048_018366 [Dryococelus australis]|uniref:Uncharacterized protein n=1 Tax=Dryococelus australis TaxID=614101 RepID=A0ABQ9HC19_9NEOP|nr:hypothetical protein PR048_018366 [Dryococelus australis]
MPLVGGFSRGSPVPPTPLHTSAAPYSPQSPSSALKTSMLRAVQISPLLIQTRSVGMDVNKDLFWHFSITEISNRQFRRFEVNFISISSPAVNFNGATVVCCDLRSDLGSSFEPRWCNRASVVRLQFQWTARLKHVVMRPVDFESAHFTVNSLYRQCQRAAVVQWLDYSPLTKANRVQYPGGVAPGFSHVGIVTFDGLSRGSPVSPALAFRRCSILASLHSHWPSRCRYQESPAQFFSLTRMSKSVSGEFRVPSKRPARLPPMAIRVQSPAGSLRIFACGNRAGRCRWSAGFLGDLPFPPPLHSGAAPYSTSIALIGSEHLDVKSRPNLFTHSFIHSRIWSLPRGLKDSVIASLVLPVSTPPPPLPTKPTVTSAATTSWGVVLPHRVASSTSSGSVPYSPITADIFRW